MFDTSNGVGRGSQVPSDRGKDRRVQKTQGLLHGALASLIHEKSYDAIVVKEILARANVGRSTFYSHFRDKDELLDRGLRDMLRACESHAPARPAGAADRILRFSLPLFTHIGQMRSASAATVDARGQAVVHERLQQVLAELIADELRAVSHGRPPAGQGVPRDLLARHVASTFLLVSSWWMESAEPLPASTANDLFRALVLPAVSEAVGA